MAETSVGTTKTCRRCGAEKPLAEFKRDPRYTGGVSSFCRVCHGAATRAWQRANPKRWNATRRAWRAANKAAINARRRQRIKKPGMNLKRYYGITRHWYAARLADQGGCCAICLRPATDFARPLAVDHDHSCCPKTPTCGGCIRGLLCTPCNTSLHALDRHPGWLTAALEYLQQYKEANSRG